MLDISHCPDICLSSPNNNANEDVSIPVVLFQTCTELVELHMIGHDLSTAVLASIATNCTSLHTISLSNSYNQIMTDDFILIFQKCIFLTYIDVNACYSLSRETYITIANTYTTQLKTLLIQASEADIQSIVMKCSQLTYLDCSSLLSYKSEQQLKAIFTHLRQLKNFHMTCVYNTSNTILHHVSLYCLHITSLHCTNTFTHDISSGIIAIAQACTELSDLNVSCSDHMSDNAICTVVLNCPNLRILNLGECFSITDITLQSLMQHSKRLVSIDMHHIKLSSGAICDLVHACKRTLRDICVDSRQLGEWEFAETHLNLTVDVVAE